MVQVQPHGAAVRLLPDVLQGLVQDQTPLLQTNGRNMLQNDFDLHLYLAVISIRPYRIRLLIEDDQSSNGFGISSAPLLFPRQDPQIVALHGVFDQLLDWGEGLQLRGI